MSDQRPDTVGDWLRSATAYLEKAGIEGAGRDVQIILSSNLGVEVGRIRLMQDDPLPAMCQSVEFKRSFWEDIYAREQRRPVSKIINRRAFWTSDFLVTDAVLDPRPETETLIEAALGIGPVGRVLDLGTGSGAIAISLAKEWPDALVIATDVSRDAIAVAGRNVVQLGVEDQVMFLESDWFSAVQGQFDLTVSNPPYIALDEMDELSPEVRGFDPRMALTDEGDGLSCYQIIAAGAGAHLKAGGWLMVEIGPTQGAAVSEIFDAAGFADVGIRRDLDGRDRVVVGQKPL
jgi:release factor glutamine methyltransferase